MISSLFVLLENDKTLYTACLFIAIMAHIISSHGKTQGSVCQEQKISQEILLQRTPHCIGMEEILVLEDTLWGLSQAVYLSETQDLHQWEGEIRTYSLVVP